MAREKHSRRGFIKGAGLMTGGVIASNVLPSGAAAASAQMASVPMKGPAQYRALLASGEPIVMPVVNNVLFARLAELEGFKALFLGGSGAADWHGVPNLGLTSITEVADFIGHIADGTTLPVFADAEAGGFDPMIVYRTTRTFERAGAAVIMIEDATGPSSYANNKGAPLASKQLMVDRMKAAVDARSDANVVILARFDAPGKGVPLDQTIDIAVACAEAGTDAFFFSGVKLEENVRLQGIIKKPMMGPGGRANTPEILKAAKVSMAYYHVERCAPGAVHQALKELKTTGKIEKSTAAFYLPGEVTDQLIRDADWTARGRKYNVIKT